MSPERARAERLKLRVARWHDHRWDRWWGPLYGGKLDDPRIVGVLLPYLTLTVDPVMGADGRRRYVVHPPEVGLVILTPVAPHMHWLAEECGLTAHLGIITLWGFIRDVCLSVAVSDIRLVLASEIRAIGSGRAA